MRLQSGFSELSFPNSVDKGSTCYPDTHELKDIDPEMWQQTYLTSRCRIHSGTENFNSLFLFTTIQLE